MADGLSGRRGSAAALIALTAVGLWSCSPAADRNAAASSSTSTGGAHAADAGSMSRPSAARAPDAGASSRADAATDAGPSVDAAGGSASGCDAPGLTWKSANKTSYTSYPAPGSDECIKYSGCKYQGMFAACDATQTESWVMAHDIVAAFPDFDALQLHDLCLRAGSKTIVVTVLDTCADADCSGCCTQNKGSADELIDVESYTAARFGVDDGPIEWADLGPTRSGGCN